MSKDSGKKSGKEKKALTLRGDGFEPACGSTSDDFQNELFLQVANSLWLPEWKDEDDKIRAAQAAYDAMTQIAPRSELEGMLAAQMIATHNAAMECLRRAMIPDQALPSRDANLKHAAKLMSLYERQLAALDKHRGKGKQTITVKHLNVNEGGQAIVGDVSAGNAQARSPAPTPKPPALNDDGASKADGEDLRGASKPKEAVRKTKAKR